jgi:hypothetical protein
MVNIENTVDVEAVDNLNEEAVPNE